MKRPVVSLVKNWASSRASPYHRRSPAKSNKKILDGPKYSLLKAKTGLNPHVENIKAQALFFFFSETVLEVGESEMRRISCFNFGGHIVVRGYRFAVLYLNIHKQI